MHPRKGFDQPVFDERILPQAKQKFAAAKPSSIAATGATR